MEDRSFTILVVDDDTHALELETLALTELGYTVVPSNSADEALRLAASGLAIDLLFTDLVMPGGTDGYALAKRLREMRPEMKIAFTSGYVSRAVSAAMAARGEPILLKPWKFDDLKDFVQDVLPA
jgi:CheY-like chemotaxis protein